MLRQCGVVDVDGTRQQCDIIYLTNVAALVKNLISCECLGNGIA